MADRLLRLYLGKGYLREPLVQGKVVELESSEQRHVRAWRLKRGSLLELLDGEGGVFRAELRSVQPAQVKVLETFRDSPPKSRLGLFFPLLAGKRMESLVENTLPWGVTSYFPVRYARGQPVSFRRGRMEKIMVETLKQCRRSFLPQLTDPLSFEESLREAENYQSKMVAHASGEEKWPRIHPNCCFFIGPEGDFSVQELKAFSARKFQRVAYRGAVLRSELAAAGFLAAAALEREDPS